MPFLYCYYPIYTLCNHCLSQCDTTLRLCRYLLWITVHEVMVPVRFPCATLLQTHDDTLTFNILLGSNCGRSGQILQLYLDNTKQPPYTDTNREREQLGFKIQLYLHLSQHVQLGRHPSNREGRRLLT